MPNVYTASIAIDSPPERTFAYVSTPANQPEWAVNFVHSTRALPDGRLAMETPVGELVYRLDADPARGTVDWIFETPAGENILPARVVPSGEGSLFTFTITRMPGQSDEAWQQGRAGLDEELQHLKRLLEAR